ncbi:hypothetical protein O181_037511 [Austropuccinia psidii MF-1]|uniref:Uncharacterized protein n=1 Tax=Austropuccinia psidii MF-1 TaxID=1389203 RepID=A0A9Q3DC89_9BASI|nr:hypothetical protein [Austropuccinia psidii MF-1]
MGKPALAYQGKELQECIREDDFHWKIIKEIIIPHRKVNIRLNPDKNRHITIGTNKENEFSLDIYQISAQNLLEELPNEFREGQFSTTLTSKQKLSVIKMLRENRPAFSIGEEPLGKIRGHDIELYLDVERSYAPMLRRPPNPASLDTRKEIENIPMSPWTWMSSERLDTMK